MKIIIPTGRKYRFPILVSDEDFKWLSERRWGIKICAGGPYATQVSRPDIMMHRELLGCVKGDGVHVDHVNGNTLDNQRHNIRKATNTQNRRNCKIPKDNTTGYKGVWMGRNLKFRAGISVNSRTIHLGTYKTAIEAAQAYDQAAIKFFGEFARLNFPPSL